MSIARRGGYGTCAVYESTVSPDGALLFFGSRFVAHCAAQATNLEAQREAVISAFERASCFEHGVRTQQIT